MRNAEVSQSRKNGEVWRSGNGQRLAVKLKCWFLVLLILFQGQLMRRGSTSDVMKLEAIGAQVAPGHVGPDLSSMLPWIHTQPGQTGPSSCAVMTGHARPSELAGWSGHTHEGRKRWTWLCGDRGRV